MGRTCVLLLFELFSSFQSAVALDEQNQLRNREEGAKLSVREAFCFEKQSPPSPVLCQN